ncbi:uncharacterized protein [Asterias amurensis]|uniref:uncharacterized protein n=1 Tax=Asterias amurensis TaxID=7602 RepID=UPI003AB16B9F
MATHSLNTTLNWLLDRHMECIICSEKYNRPKVLTCLHTFCQECLLNYYRDKKVMPCPICDKLTPLPEDGVPGLKANFFIDCLLDDFSTLKTGASSSEKQSEDGVKREQHTECLKLFCVPCKKLTSRECAVIDHPETGAHRIIDCKDAALELRKSLQDAFPDRKRDIEGCKQSLQASSKAKNDFEERVAIAVAAVHAKVTEVTAQVNREEERLLKDIETLMQGRNARFDEHGETVTKMLQETQYTLDVAEDIVKNCSDSTFLDLYPDMTSLMTSSQPVPQIDRRLSRLTFEQSTTTDIDLGTLEKEGELQPVKEGKWELCNKFEICPVITGMVALAHSNELAVIPHDQPRAVIINDSTGKVANALQVQAGAHSIVEAQDKLVVVSTESDRVNVYNRDGTREFDFGTVPEHLHGRDFNVNLRGVAVKRMGTIIVGDVSNTSISEHFPDGSILRLIFFKGDKQPFDLAVDSQDRIVVGDRSSEVVVIDDNGDTLITIKPTIGGVNKVKCVSMVCDGSGIYITVSFRIDNERHSHIHQYDNEGNFLKCIIKDLFCPMAIQFTSDGQRLAVADTPETKIYHKV